MKIDEMLRGMASRTSFHMPGHKMRFGQGSAWDVTELDRTDDLHSPRGPYCDLAGRLAARCGAAASFPLVGGSTRGVQLMVLSSLKPGQRLILPRNAHSSAWSACALGGVDPIPVPLRMDAEMQIPCLDAQDLCSAIAAHPEAGAVLLTRPDYYGRLFDLTPVVCAAHAQGMKVLVDEAHGAHLPFAGERSCGRLGADLWVQSLHKTLPALTPCAVLHAADASIEGEVRRIHRLLETSSPSSLLLHAMERCLDYMDDHPDALARLTSLCAAFREGICADGRFARTAAFYERYDVDPTRLVIDVRETGLTGFEAARRMEMCGVDMEMADDSRVIGIPSVMTTQEDMDALLCALRALPCGSEARTPALPKLAFGRAVCGVRQAALGSVRRVPLDRAADLTAAESLGIYPPGVPLCVPGERVTPAVVEAMQAARRLGGTLFGVDDKGEIAVVSRRYDVVIFDLDGTLMDTSLGVMRSVQYALRAMGLPDGDLDTIRRFIGPPLHASFVQFYGMCDEEAAEAVAHYRERYARQGVLEYKPYPGMAELIRELTAAGTKVCVATGKPEKFSRIILEREGLLSHIERLLTPSLSDTRDNKPEMVRAILAACGRNALMVGDRCFDIQGARANGIDSAGVLHGFGGREELERSGATFIVEGARDLRGILL